MISSHLHSTQINQQKHATTQSTNKPTRRWSHTENLQNGQLFKSPILKLSKLSKSRISDVNIAALETGWDQSTNWMASSTSSCLPAKRRSQSSRVSISVLALGNALFSNRCFHNRLLQLDLVLVLGLVELCLTGILLGVILAVLNLLHVRELVNQLDSETKTFMLNSASVNSILLSLDF